MEVWAIRVFMLGAVSTAAAQDVTVYFGAPAEEQQVVEVVPEACPRSVRIERAFDTGRESFAMPLLDCSRQPREEAVRALSVIMRPRTSAAPGEDALFADDPDFVAEGIRRVHPELLERIARIAEAFEGHTIEIQSGYRPNAPRTSRHFHARAADLFVIGVPREQVRDLARTFDQTGVGWYPNSTFVHIDVREESEYWIDVSRPGESPRYVGEDGERPRRTERPRARSTRRAAAEEVDVRTLLDETREVLRGIRLEAPAQ
jgi:hypothetical protein